MGVIVTGGLPTDPLDALRALARIEAELDELRRKQVAGAREAGATWEQVGEALGISRQSAWEYYAARTRAEIAANAAANAVLLQKTHRSRTVPSHDLGTLIPFTLVRRGSSSP